MKDPKLRTVEKYNPPYPLNQFPKEFGLGLGREIVYFLASRGTPRLEGTDWEEIFARLVGAQWSPSNVGLDDIIFQQTAWGAKTVKNKNPITASKVRLISGRNSPGYSFGDKKVVVGGESIKLGEKILTIWNERVAGVRKKFRHLRTVVLIKSDNLLELSMFEFDTRLYQPEDYVWEWNKNKNLVGRVKTSGEHIFTWQPHGSQFTINEDVPKDRLSIRIKQPPILNKEDILKTLKFDRSWIEIIK